MSVNKNHEQAVRQAYFGSGRELAIEANRAFDLRADLAGFLAGAVVAARDDYNQSQPYWQDRIKTIENELREAHDKFTLYELGAKLKMPHKLDFETQTLQEPTEHPAAQDS